MGMGDVWGGVAYEYLCSGGRYGKSGRVGELGGEWAGEGDGGDD